MKFKREKYLQANGEICPYCGSNEINAGSRDSESNLIIQSVECRDCGRQWTDIFKLVNVLEL